MNAQLRNAISIYFLAKTNDQMISAEIVASL